MFLLPDFSTYMQDIARKLLARSCLILQVGFYWVVTLV